MLLVSAKQLKSGMVTAMPVLHPRRSSIHLVQDNVPLTADIIARLNQLAVHHVWVKHPLLRDLDAILLSKVPEKRRAIYDAIKGGFDHLQDRVITTDDYRYYRQTIADLINELLGRSSKAGDLAERLFSDGDELTSHSSNVAYLAVTVGMHLETYIARRRERVSSAEARDLTSLGVGAMLHDLGKLDGPPEVRRQHETTRERHPEYAKHALDGFDALRDRVSPVACTVALHHHQRWDGGGWPDMTELTHGRHTGGLSGQRIHVFARIVAAANVFDNLAARSGLPGIYALHAMQTNRFEGAFDPMVLDAFLRHVPPFPTGALVTLSDGRPAAVTGIGPDQPCRPTVRPLDDESDGADVDLSGQPDLFIREAQGHDVTRWLYDLPPKAAAVEAAALG